MSSLFYRIFLFVFSFVSFSFFAQNYTDGLSDGELKVDGKTIPVKIFATTSSQTFVDFPQQNKSENTLVILNDEIKEYNNSGIFRNYQNENYQILDKKQTLVFTKQIKQRLTHQLIESKFFTVSFEKKPTSMPEDGMWVKLSDINNYAFPKTISQFIDERLNG